MQIWYWACSVITFLVKISKFIFILTDRVVLLIVNSKDLSRTFGERLGVRAYHFFFFLWNITLDLVVCFNVLLLRKSCNQLGNKVASRPLPLWTHMLLRDLDPQWPICSWWQSRRWILNRQLCEYFYFILTYNRI